MERAGTSVIFLSWSGWGNDNLYTDPGGNPDGVIDSKSIATRYSEAVKSVLDQIRNKKLPSEFPILVEDFPHNLRDRKRWPNDCDTRTKGLTDAQRKMVMVLRLKISGSPPSEECLV